MTHPDIIIHPSVTMRKYHDREDDPPFHWTAECAYEELRRRLPDTAIHLTTRQELDSGIFAQTRVLLCGAVQVETLAMLPNLEWLQFTGSGADHFFKASGLGPEEFKARGVKVLNSPGISRFPVAEHVMAMLLALGRGIPRALRQQLRHEWTIYTAREIRGKTLGIIGLGEIGERVASLARAFGMQVVACKRDPSRHDGNAHIVVGVDKTGDVIAAADFLVLLTPLSDRTRDLFNYDTFRRMKRGSYFINVARGESVNEGDLVRALGDGTLAGAAVDTFGPIAFDDAKKMEALGPESALWDLPNMLVMPNNAASSEHYMSYFADAATENYLRWRAGRPFKSVVA